MYMVNKEVSSLIKEPIITVTQQRWKRIWYYMKVKEWYQNWKWQNDTESSSTCDDNESESSGLHVADYMVTWLHG